MAAENEVFSQALTDTKICYSGALLFLTGIFYELRDNISIIEAISINTVYSLTVPVLDSQTLILS